MSMRTLLAFASVFAVNVASADEAKEQAKPIAVTGKLVVMRGGDVQAEPLLVTSPREFRVQKFNNEPFSLSLELRNDTNVTLTPVSVGLSCGCAKGSHSVEPVLSGSSFKVDIGVSKAKFESRNTGFSARIDFEEWV